jgi:hypothetical protein
MDELLEAASELDVLRFLLGVMFLLLVFRRLFKRALLRWIDGPETSDGHELAEIIACEKRRMAEESKSESIRAAHKGE